MNLSNQSVKIDKHIEVVSTATTGMKETGFGSIQTARALFNILKNNYTHVAFTEVQCAQDLNIIAKKKPDLVVPCVKYITLKDTNEKLWLSSFFTQHSIPITGSQRAALEFDSDKGKAKKAILDLGIATAKFFFASPEEYKSEKQLPLKFPLFVKPMDAANGHGIDEHSLVHDFASYKTKIIEIHSYYGVPALVEEYLPGREFTVAVLDDSIRKQRIISPVEIIPPMNARGDRILGHVEKTGNDEKLIMVSDQDYSTVSGLVDKVFSALGVRDFGRIDVKMDKNGKPYFIEANLLPGMTPLRSYFPRACLLNNGISYDQLVLRMVELALNRLSTPANTPPSNLLANRVSKLAA